MLINNINITTFKAKLLNKEIQTAEVTIYDDWLRNSLNPLYLGKQESYKQITISLVVEDSDDESALNDISNLIKQFEKSTIRFDDISYYYDCLIVNKSHERLIEGKYFLSIELKSGYAYKATVTETANRVFSKTINASGNLEAPAIVEITPSSTIIDITVTGLGDAFTIKNLTAGNKVIINGENCTVTQNGVNKYLDFEGWEFPKLQPGSNTITFSVSSCDVTIKYKPRYL